MQTDNATWGDVPVDEKLLAHRDENMTCLPVILRDDELFWLSSIDAGKSQDAERHNEAAIRVTSRRTTIKSCATMCSCSAAMER